MKKIFFATLLLATSAFAAVDARVYATWETAQPLFATPEFTYYLQMTLSPNTMVAAGVCKFADGTVLKPSVQVAAQITETEIAVVANAENKVSQNGKNCDIAVAAGNKMPYAITSDTGLTMTDPASGMSLHFVKK